MISCTSICSGRAANDASAAPAGDPLNYRAADVGNRLASPQNLPQAIC